MKNYLFDNRENTVKSNNIKFDDRTKLNFSQYKNAIIAPTLPHNNSSGGVFDENKIFIKKSLRTNTWLARGGEYSLEDNITFLNIDTIFLGFFTKHWGHFLVDCSDLFWILLLDEFKNFKVVYLPDYGNEINGNYLRFLELLGVDKSRLLCIEKPTRFRTVVIPDSAKINDNLYSEIYRKVFKKVIENSCYKNINVPRKVYFSRQHFKNKQEIGEQEIQKTLQQNGFESIYPEETSLDYQIAIFQKSSCIVCINGSIALNCVFGNERSKVIVLNKCSLRHDNLLNIDEFSKAQLMYIDVYNEPVKGFPKYLGEGPFWIEVNENFVNWLNDQRYCYDTSVVKRRRTYRAVEYMWKYLMVKCKNMIKNEVKDILKIKRNIR